MVGDQLDDYANATIVGVGQKSLEVLQGPIAGMNRPVVGNVVTVISQGRREEGHQPDCVDAKILNVVHALGEALEVANAVSVAVYETANMDLINDGVLVPAGFAL